MGWKRVDLNTGYSGGSLKLTFVGHGLNVFSGVSLLVVTKLVLLPKISSGEGSCFLCGMSYFVLCHEKLCPIVLLFVYGVIFIYPFC